MIEALQVCRQHSNLLAKAFKEWCEEQAWCNSHDADLRLRKVARHWQSHADDGALACCVCDLTNLAFKACNACSVDDDATRLICALDLILEHLRHSKAADIEGA